jgi:response regulator RpfG family c-di-GMP phosphodiesterase
MDICQSHERYVSLLSAANNDSRWTTDEALRYLRGYISRKESPVSIELTVLCIVDTVLSTSSCGDVR